MSRRFVLISIEEINGGNVCEQDIYENRLNALNMKAKSKDNGRNSFLSRYIKSQGI